MPYERPPSPAVVSGFKGLNNRLQPPALGWQWQLAADNLLCDDAGFLCLRPGPRLVGGGYRDAFGARDGRLMLVTDDSQLVVRHDDGTQIALASGVIGAPFSWCEMGNTLFLLSRRGKWAIYPDRAIRWGSLCPPPDTAAPVDEMAVYPPPDGDLVAARRGQVAIASYDPATDRTAIYLSRPDYPHEFRLERDFFMLPGRVLMLAGVRDQLVIGTTNAFYIEGETVQRVADFGAAGPHASDERGLIYCMTPRGLYQALPFEPMTEANHAPETRADVSLALLPWQGSTYCIAHQTGEVRQRPQSAPYTPKPITAVRENGITID